MKNVSTSVSRYWFALATIVVLFAGCSTREKDLIIFQDVTKDSSLETYTGMTFGANWADFDSDGKPDIYVPNHLNQPQLFRNLGNGRFADVTTEFFAPEGLTGDKHGAAWADFNNDGKQDLVQLTGAVMGLGSEPKRLFVNTGLKLADNGDKLGVSNPYGRTRMPLWYDFNGDGLLDLFHGAEGRFDDRIPPFTFEQQKEHFVESDVLKLKEKVVPFCTITEVNGDNHAEVICRVSGKNRTSLIFDTKTIPARELGLLPATAFEDVAAADFDNDGKIDFFLARKNPAAVVAFGHPKDNELVADVLIEPINVGKPAGFTFESPGQLNVRVYAANPKGMLTPEMIYLGQQGTHPAALSFDLSASTSGISGVASPSAANQTAVYVGYVGSDKWEVRVTAPREAPTGGKLKHQQIALKISSSQPIRNANVANGAVEAEEAPARLFMNRDGKFVEESEKRGVNRRLIAATNVVTGDFDNDMDMDLFVVASGDIGKQENLLLLNRGDGKFDIVKTAGGAAGDKSGVGDSVTTADFDSDGFLDLLVATGGSMGRSLGIPSEQGAYHLYRNVGNGNHWLEIDLEGTKSNRDGIGAVVRVTAGEMTQIRVQDNGVHHRSQNHSRLHFGLAQQTAVEKISIHWPSGAVQELAGIKANQIIRIKEQKE